MSEGANHRFGPVDLGVNKNRPAATAKDWDHAPIRVERINDLILDWSLYPRKEIDELVVSNYAKALTVDCIFPPIKVGLLRGKKIVVDGVHRIESRQKLNIEFIECAILEFKRKAELFAEAVRLNSEHGHAFNEDDVKANIKRLKRYKFDVEEIVALTHVPASEIYREFAAPITVVRAPCGKRVYCTKQPNGRELVEFKKALTLIRDVAKSGCLPTDDGFFMDLVDQCHEALGKVRFNG